MIKAPYNFVPLSQKVVFPDWGAEISIDRPFEDGISGTIDVKYTAQTPVFIGNGKDNNNSSVENYKSANGKYAIPGSSLRGMLRNIVEIISFGKLNRVSDAALSVRDLTPAAREIYTNFFTKKTTEKIDENKIKKEVTVYEAKSQAGWLDYDEEKNAWVLYYVKYHRIEDKIIKNKYGVNDNLLKERKNLEDRINLVKNKGLKVQFVAELTKPHKHHFIKKEKKGAKESDVYLYLKYSKVTNFEIDNNGNGYIVLTGQPGTNKHMDFIFEDKGKDKKDLNSEIIRQFQQANSPKSNDQKEGFILTKKLKEYNDMGYPGIPVFYLPNQDGTPNSLGLSQMYRLPYKNSLHDAIKHSSEGNFSDELDFAECIFGKIKDTKKRDESTGNFSLRGRVQFEDATTDNEALDSQVETILGTPKPTYYPNYIEQDDGNQDYKTLMDNDVTLRGWKRYPVKDKINHILIGQNKDVGTHFSPLQKGTEFKGKIHFHNLKKEELGALLWAITWGDDKNLSHAVGMGKPYGFGQIKAEIMSLSYLYNNSDDNVYQNANATEWNNWINTFIKYMEDEVVNWGNSPQLTELKAMANPKNAERSNWNLSHMILVKSYNEFVNAKKSKSFLARYSEDNQEKHLAGNHNFIGGMQRNNDSQNHGGQKNNKPNFTNQAPQKVNLNNGVVMCILLKGKTKRGCWKAEVKNNSDISGHIENSNDVPADKKAGDEINLRIKYNKGKNSCFIYDEKLK